MSEESKDTQPMVRQILLEMRDEFAKLRAEMREEFTKVRIDMNEGFDALRQELELTHRQIAKMGFQLERALVRVDVIEERFSKLEGESNPQ